MKTRNSRQYQSLPCVDDEQKAIKADVFPDCGVDRCTECRLS